ncbi:MAG TPA: acyl-CoA dehydrogenase family protein [Acetobacteraceae bacterium]|nr:acyl-CoA dehydrogenase family protein [Acetobacteraceae bacterium]
MRNADVLLANVGKVADAWQSQRSERQRRRQLDPDDFRQLQALGLPLAAVPAEFGGLWESTQRSVRPLCEALRCLARGDPSVALSASMHPGVLAFWRESPPLQPASTAWEAQKQWVYQTALDGAWWGTITSESGSGGDVGKTRAMARPDAAGYRITGEKHFGSGSGATSYMLTTAVPEGEDSPAWFFLDLRDTPWDGSTGVSLIAAWDGHGMAATNSHSFAFRDFPATRLAWPGSWREVLGGGGTVPMFYTAVIVGVVDAAMDYARQQMQSAGWLATRAFEKVEWVGAEREAWLLRQAYEGGLQALERLGRARDDTALAKANVALLAESVLTRLCRISGGSAFSRRGPLGFWFEDVRALGFLRPPWGLGLEALFDMSAARPA